MPPELLEFASHQQGLFDAATSLADRKERGHYGTPPAIANFMAGLFSTLPTDSIRILDPGAGVGTLSAAMCNRLLQLDPPLDVFIELWETDPRLEAPLRDTMQRCAVAMRTAGHRFEYMIRTDDFILASSDDSLFVARSPASFHVAIMNPPYYKLRKDSPQARSMPHVVHGQPNVYALFMAAATDWLLPRGQMVAITPRSYFSGPYFRRFRRWYFDRMTARQIHVFESRSEAFRADQVLQENVVLLAEKGGIARDIALTSSVGADFQGLRRSSAPYESVITSSRADHVVRVISSDFDRQIVAALDRLPCRFRTLGFDVSTGPVVAFRATDFLRHERAGDTAPLLWSHNVRPFVTRFPAKSPKPLHIVVSEQSRRLLLQAGRYVLLKRFTAKEEKKRVVAGILDATDSYSPWIGLENHLNYIYRRDAQLSECDAWGLAALFNSTVIDRYFRAVSGNTQVNAAEIRELPVPTARAIARLGEQVELAIDRSARELERLVGRALDLPASLIEQLVEHCS
ncbi:MAG: Eco57I restriction-modification methylase domain-containing protein [Pirellulales bacterium]|nr:Eco57I restriction-modification methylase domain-containing protein [Pirellulales bacterium]